MRGVLESDEDTLKGLKSTFDFLLSTIPESHDTNPFTKLLKRDSAIVVVGALEKLKPVDNMEMAQHRKQAGASLIGSITILPPPTVIGEVSGP